MSDSIQSNTLKNEWRHLTSRFEIAGSLLAMVYALSIAANVGAELIAFALLLISSGLFAAWAIIDGRWAFLMLQIFYAASGIIGLMRWS